MSARPRQADESDEPTKVSEDKWFSMPFKVIISLVIAVAIAAASWGSIKQDVVGNTQDIADVKTDIRAIRAEQQTQRELLIRIDAKLPQGR